MKICDQLSVSYLSLTEEHIIVSELVSKVMFNLHCKAPDAAGLTAEHLRYTAIRHFLSFSASFSDLLCYATMFLLGFVTVILYPILPPRRNRHYSLPQRTHDFELSDRT